MAKGNHIIVCVHLTDRISNALEVQKAFTRYGGYIKTRWACTRRRRKARRPAQRTG